MAYSHLVQTVIWFLIFAKMLRDGDILLGSKPSDISSSGELHSDKTTVEMFSPLVHSINYVRIGGPNGHTVRGHTLNI